ncbi:MAG TPA: hypothetical protein VGB96_23250 [Archangium sp.]|jgi:hypothetical protein
MHFLAARAAYRGYLENGRAFLFARSLRRVNVAARTLLMSRGHLLPPPLQEDAAALVAHYDVWLTLWDAHRKALRPALADAFVFENSFTYPKDSEGRIEALFTELSGVQEGLNSPSS